MKYQLLFMQSRDGTDAAIVYAKQTLKAYRQAARIRGVKGRHFCHEKTFRPHFVQGILDIREFLRNHPEPFIPESAQP